MATRCFFHAMSTLPLFAAFIVNVTPTLAQGVADPIRACKAARNATDKVQFCSDAIATASDNKTLERVFLRRGNAFVELQRFDLAVGDFTRLIQIAPTVAGYYDNRAFANNADSDVTGHLFQSLSGHRSD